jgi:hypothetical protein
MSWTNFSQAETLIDVRVTSFSEVVRQERCERAVLNEN